MDNIQAAILLPQLERIKENSHRRDQLARIYETRLDGLPGITVPQVLPGVVHARHLYPVWISGSKRDQVVEALQSKEIGTVVNYRAIHLLSYFRECFGFKTGDFPQAEKIGDSTLSLPFYPKMIPEQVDYVTECLSEAVAI